MTDASKLITVDALEAACYAYDEATYKAGQGEEGAISYAMRAALTAVLPALIRQAREGERERAANKADAVAERNQAIVDYRPTATATGLPFEQALANYLAAGGVGAAREIAAAIRRTEPTP